MRIFLIGMPGSGKSTIGRYLSDSLQSPFLDLDKLIEERMAMSIREIFEKVGEKGFRQLERETLTHVIAEFDRGVISTGGGAPCFFDNLAQMKQAGKTIYLDVPLDTLITRTSKSAKRPLLQGNPAEKLTSLLKERQEIYQQAEIVFSTHGRESLDVARDLTELFERFKT